jgi:hypothetical protein
MADFGIIQGAWAQSKPVDAKRFVPDPGVYRCIVDDVKSMLMETKKGLKVCIRWKLKIIEGEFKDFDFEKTEWLSDNKSCAFLKGEMRILGLEIPVNANDIDIALSQAAGLFVNVEVAKQGEFTNIFIRERIRNAAFAQTSNDDLSVFDNPAHYVGPDMDY